MNTAMKALAIVLLALALVGVFQFATDECVSADDTDTATVYWSSPINVTYNGTEYSIITSFRVEVNQSETYTKEDMRFLDVIIVKGTLTTTQEVLGADKDLSVVNITVPESWTYPNKDAKEMEPSPEDKAIGIVKKISNAVKFDLVFTDGEKATLIPNIPAEIVILKIDIKDFIFTTDDVTFNWLNYNANTFIYKSESIKAPIKDKDGNITGYECVPIKDREIYKVDEEHKSDWFNITNQTEMHAGTYNGNDKNATLSITADENNPMYFGTSKNVSFTINPKDISTITSVKVINPDYNGLEQLPSFVLKDRDDQKVMHKLIQNPANPLYHFEIVESNLPKQINHSKTGYVATNAIKGVHDFTGYLNIIWNINQIPLGELVLDPDSFNFKNGVEQGPSTIKVVNNTVTPIEGKDYTLSGTFTAIEAGSYTIKATAIIDGNYSGDASKEWNILGINWNLVLKPTSFMYNGKEQGPKISIVDDNGENLPIKDFVINGVTKAIEPNNYTVTAYPKTNNYVNLEKSESWMIFEPLPFVGEVHVNIIITDGSLDGNMFDDNNTFVYPYEPTYTMYDNQGKTVIGMDHPAICRDDYSIVVLDANGNTVVNELYKESDPEFAKPNFTTSSEWNHIELYAKETSGFKGCITGNFYIHFETPSDSKSYEIGDSFTEDSITYTVTSLDNKTVSVTGYETGIQTGVSIPDYVNGFKVTKIGAKAFYGCKTITSVDLGENITSVGIKAFANCTKLETVVFDDALKTISAYAFYNCGKLTSIDLPDKVRTIGSYAFYKCNALTSVSFDDALKTVGTKAFTVSFENASGKVLKQTAKNLAGKTFEGSDKVLKLVA